MKNLKNLKGVKALSKKEQKNVNGGLNLCPVNYPNGCFDGPFYCPNTNGLPLCNPLNDTQ